MTAASALLPTPVWLFFAVKEEAAIFLKSLPALQWKRQEPVEGRGVTFIRGQSTLRLFISGMGSQCTRDAWDNALEDSRGEKTGCVLTCGFAGALDPALQVGDILCQRNSLFPPLGFPEGDFFCSEQVILRAVEKERLYRESGCRAVEMESGILHELCQREGIACATLRVISDSAHEDLPLDFCALSKPDGTISIPALAGELILHPGKIPALIRLGKNTRLAARNLSASLSRLFA